MIGMDDSDRVIRFSSDPISSNREKKSEISDNYLEIRSQNLLSSIQGFALNQINAPRVWESNILEYTSWDSLENELPMADVVVVDRPWQVPYIAERVDHDTPLVYSSHNVESELYSHLDSSYLTKGLLTTVRDLEQNAIETADLTITISSRDKNIYQNKFDKCGEIHVAPAAGYKNTIEDQQSASPALPFNKDSSDFIACFVGNDHYPNIEAVNEIASMARRTTDDGVQYLIIGNVCDQFSEDSVPPNMHLLGFVDSIEPYYSLSDIALNPICSGSGVNIKMLEYFQQGVTTLSTPFGARGVEAEPGVHYAQSDISNFPEKIVHLKNNPSEREDMSSNAKLLIQEKLNWETVSKNLFSKLREL
ncbi:hypothetical protein C499_13130 [Halogeometricum borinquense DSM 11551]|uniref:Glycosyltransferase n=2 Tax=Halogeometricum borinquense TaxID=60847 RepID=E4NUH1_HALBP|nr:hypothetical protein Hbor_31560 [Halogeometricum borinquense DSM 11551]ELY25431.1 hypothetical protein C499_13130 [Halogeometricum borinquense DSM 11551]